jgi:U2-associated protein SR140
MVESAQDDERAIPNPRLLMSSLPPNLSEEIIRALLPENLIVEQVEHVAPDINSLERQSKTVYVTLASNTPASEIETAISGLQKRYLGCGFYLSISKALSSAVGHTATDTSDRQLPQAVYNNPATPYQPESYSAPMVEVVVPTDRMQLQLIHRTIENLLEHGPEFEAVLMNNEEIQQDEDWAFLYDGDSVGGVYYRYRVWHFASGAWKREDPRNIKRARSPIVMFEGEPAWIPPPQLPKFEFSTYIDNFDTDAEFESGADDSSDDDAPQAQQLGGIGNEGPKDSIEACYLNSEQRAKLTHLLVRLPTSIGRLRRGDVARVTHFAIAHAAQSAEDIVDMLLMNLEMPFVFTSANPDYDRDDEYVYDTDYYSDASNFSQEDEPNDDVIESIEKPDAPVSEEGKPAEKAKENEKKNEKEKEDPSSAKLIALYLISDLIIASHSSGVTNSYKFRQLFETALIEHRVFERLGRLENSMNWGKIRAERWRTSVDNVLNIWASWSIYSDATMKTFGDQLKHPGLSAKDKAAAAKKEQVQAHRKEMVEKWKSMKLMETQGGGETKEDDTKKEEQDEVEADAMGELDVYGDNEKPNRTADVEMTVQNSILASTLEASTPSKSQKEVAEATGKTKESTSANELGLTKAAIAKLRRPKAIDMFADSESD